MNNVILHCDCNAFFASVAELVNPELKKVPMAVSGDPFSRSGIILAKNENAKKYGIQTAETVWQAYKKCPDLVLAPTYRSLYTKYFLAINDIYEEYTDIVERFGIDESFLDVTHSIHLFGGDPVHLANTIRERVKKETGLSISIGVSDNKFFAKMGSDYKKPDAVTYINKENFKEILWDKPISIMFMVGEATQKKLETLFIRTIGDLATTNKDTLTMLLGSSGEMLYTYANGLDDSKVVSYREEALAKSVGNGQTFKRNLVEQKDITAAVASLADQVGTRLRKSGLKCMQIQVTIKDTALKSITRQEPLKRPTFTAKEITRVALKIISKAWEEGKPIRMLTITASKFVKENDAIEQMSFFDEKTLQEDNIKQENLENALDVVRAKYGKSSIHIGSLLDNDLGIH